MTKELDAETKSRIADEVNEGIAQMLWGMDISMDDIRGDEINAKRLVSAKQELIRVLSIAYVVNHEV